jgi:uncharacterized protein YbaP (TraB family)
MLNHLLRQVLLLFVCGGIYFSVHGQKYLHKKVLHTVLWKISGQGLTNPSFLFGVDHVQAYEPFVKKYPQLDSVMAFCETLIVENIPTSGGGGVDYNLLYFHSDSSIAYMLKPDQYQQLVKYINFKSGNNKDVLNNLVKMRPQLLVMAIPMLSGAQLASETSEVQMMDQGLLQAAAAKGMQKMGLEDAHERSLAVLNGLTDKEAVRQVLQEIKGQSSKQTKSNKRRKTKNNAQNGKKETGRDQYDELQIHYYFNRSIKGNDYGGVQFRNQLWLGKIPHLLEQHCSLICVGLAHLKTKEGLIQQLRQLGYSVETIPMTATTD